MLFAALLSGIIIAARPATPHAKMSVWLFAESHQRSYVGEEHSTGETPQHKYTRTTGNSLDIVLMNARAEDVRLLSIFDSHGKGQVVPDAAEVEISHVGKFFRPPTSDIGFLPLNDFLKRSGWYDRIVKARFAPWSKKGVIFGIPHDLHPTAICYRKDLFDEAHVDLAGAKSWPEFAHACRAFQRYWLDHGKRRWAIGLTKTSSDNIVIMLQL
jgi:arabinosaccharide transport system substrate-binding protein